MMTMNNETQLFIFPFKKKIEKKQFEKNGRSGGENQSDCVASKQEDGKKILCLGNGGRPKLEFRDSTHQCKTKRNKKIMQRAAAAESSEKIVARIRPCLTFINHPNG
jgi:hypothetical protein